MDFDYFSTPWSLCGDKLIVEVVLYTPPKPLPVLSAEELALIPDQFRCYICYEHYLKKDFGGCLLNQRICRHCYPWVDEWDVGIMIRFDLRRGFARCVQEST